MNSKLPAQGVKVRDSRQLLQLINIRVTFAAGNLFGVSLSTLLLRDSQLSSEESNIPLVFQKVLNELTRRGVREEGILRVGGHKQKVYIFSSFFKIHLYIVNDDR